MKVVLISCVKSKLSTSARAEDLYTSTLFRGSLKYAKSFQPGRIFILSAKYGLVDLDEVIDPYEETLKGKPLSEVRVWADRVLGQLATKTNLDGDHFVLFAGLPYRRFLTPHLKSFEVPLEGLGLGKQLEFYAGLH